MENQNPSPNISITEDPPVQERFSKMELENQQLKDEFNSQRAKMKELYLQKEEEVKSVIQEKDNLKSELELIRQQLQHLEHLNSTQRSEIESLQLLIQETFEESSNTSNVEIRKLQLKCTEYEQQINLLNRQSTSSPEMPLAPSAIVQAVTKRIARRLGADPNCQESLEDSMKKAQEDADVLRSLVVPLEEEIAALKEKLRETDSQLQQSNEANAALLRNSKISNTSNVSKDNAIDGGCDMCTNYEAQLVSEQAKSKEHYEKAYKTELSLKRALEELERERSLRQDTLSEWQAVREGIANQMQDLTQRLSIAELKFENAKTETKTSHTILLDDITQLTVDRETLQERLDSLQHENEKLVGKYLTCAEKLQIEDIDLPNNLADLQEYALKQREELIIALMERERAQASEQTLAILQKDVEELQILNENLKIKNNSLRKDIENFSEEIQQVNLIKEQARSAYEQLKECMEKKEGLEKKVVELHGKVVSLQRYLNTSETVQKDFVKLSQTLQVQLERIRSSEVEVRWQHEEDVEECSSCHINFSVSKKKQHCRHCGRIFCSNCLSHTVNSGPRARPAHVCDVCYTLLVRDTAPYFSNEVPHTPD